MHPTLKNGECILVLRFFFFLKEGDIVIVKDIIEKKSLVKRIKKSDNGKYYVIGDNEKESTDSRHFGWVNRKQIFGKFIHKI